jgi:hypothetical protein
VRRAHDLARNVRWFRRCLERNGPLTLRRVCGELVHRLVNVTLLRPRTRTCGDSNENRGSLAGPGDDLEIAADHVRSLFHADETETAAVPADSLEVEPPAVVSDGQLDVVRGSGDRDLQSSRLAVYRAVSERFLSDSKQAQRDIRLNVFEVAPSLEAHVNVMPFLDFDAVRFQCRSEADQS